MTTRNDEIYNICANIVNYMKDDIDGFNPHMSNSEYLDDLISKIDNLIDRKIPQYCGDDIRKDFKNIKQPTQIFVEKEMLNTEYKTDDEKIKVVIGLYTNQDIKNYNQTTTVIKKDTLLDVLSGEVEVGEKKQLASDVNLPEGTY